MRLFLFVVLMVSLKRRSELDFDLSCPVGTGLPIPVVLPRPMLFNYNLIHQMAAPCSRLGCGASALTAVLLVIAGTETNPGPAAAVKKGLLNVRLMVNKRSLVQDIIISQNLDALAVRETWITCDDPNAVKLNAAPADYVISHLPHPTATVRSQGSGVCLIHRKYHCCQMLSITVVFPLSVIRVPASVHEDVKQLGS